MRIKEFNVFKFKKMLFISLQGIIVLLLSDLFHLVTCKYLGCGLRGFYLYYLKSDRTTLTKSFDLIN